MDVHIYLTMTSSPTSDLGNVHQATAILVVCGVIAIALLTAVLCGVICAVHRFWRRDTSMYVTTCSTLSFYVCWFYWESMSKLHMDENY